METVDSENALGTMVAAITLPIIWTLFGVGALILSPLLLASWIQHKIDWPNGWVR